MKLCFRGWAWLVAKSTERRQPATKKAEGLRGGMIATGMVFDLEKFVDWCYDGIK